MHDIIRGASLQFAVAGRWTTRSEQPSTRNPYLLKITTTIATTIAIIRNRNVIGSD